MQIKTWEASLHLDARLAFNIQLWQIHILISLEVHDENGVILCLVGDQLEAAESNLRRAAIRRVCVKVLGCLSTRNMYQFSSNSRQRPLSHGLLDGIWHWSIVPQLSMKAAQQVSLHEPGAGGVEAHAIAQRRRGLLQKHRHTRVKKKLVTTYWLIGCILIINSCRVSTETPDQTLTQRASMTLNDLEWPCWTLVWKRLTAMARVKPITPCLVAV